MFRCRERLYSLTRKRTILVIMAVVSFLFLVPLQKFSLGNRNAAPRHIDLPETHEKIALPETWASLLFIAREAFVTGITLQPDAFPKFLRENTYRVFAVKIESLKPLKMFFALVNDANLKVTCFTTSKKFPRPSSVDYWPRVQYLYAGRRPPKSTEVKCYTSNTIHHMVLKAVTGETLHLAVLHGNGTNRIIHPFNPAEWEKYFSVTLPLPALLDNYTTHALETDFVHYESHCKHRAAEARHLVWSKFLPCKVRPGNDTHQFSSDVKTIGRERGVMIGLEGGHVLGWWRNCSQLSHEPDFDFSYVEADAETHPFIDIADGPVSESYTALSPIRGNIYPWRRFGTADKPLEQSFLAMDDFVRLDLIQWKRFNATHHYNTETFHDEYLIYLCLFDSSDGWCATLFLGEVFLVPCNPEAYLTAQYGNDWTAPIIEQTSFCMTEASVYSQQYTEKDWKRRGMFKEFWNL